jgi:lipid-binding SYLF domain-containing protein
MRLFSPVAVILLLSFAVPSWADSYQEAQQVFQRAAESQPYFEAAYGYALFPTIGKGGIGIGGAHGRGRVYRQGTHVGNARLTQLSVGFQLGGQAYSQVIFFEDERAFDEFTGGNFEFAAEANAVVVTAGASARAATAGGASGGLSGGKNDATVVGGYYKGAAVFIVPKGGLMFEASIAGQRFTYTPLGEASQDE